MTEKSNLLRLIEVMNTLRSPGGCPWDGEQTHESLLTYLLEESYEFIDAVERNNRDDMVEELGDVLLQVYFHARIGEERTNAPFSIEEVAGSICDKLIRRHPHVFAGETAETPEQVLVLWNAAKAEEKRARTSVLDGVSERMPTLALAQKLVGKAGSLPALTSPRLGGGADATPPATPASEDELGDALLALVSTARDHGWDAERALRQRLRTLAGEIRAAEAEPTDLEE